MLCDDHQHAHRPVGEAHVQTLERILVPGQHARAVLEWRLDRRLAQFPARHPGSEVGEHDHAHQRAEEIGEPLLALLEHARVQHREDRAHHAFGGDVRWFADRVGDPSPAIDHLRDLLEHFGAPVQDPLAGAERLDDAQLGEPRLLVHEHQQPRQRRADPLAPARLAHVCFLRDQPRLAERLLERGQKAILAVRENVVEGLARDARAADHLRDRHPRVADLLHRFHRSGEHAASLDLGDLPARQSSRARPQPRCRGSCLVHNSHVFPV